MANLHSNMLVIVADEENMVKVMRLFWENYESAATEAGFDEEPLYHLTVERLWKPLRKYLEQRYEYAFRKDFLGSEGDQVVGERAIGPGMTVDISIAPWGRPGSDTAVVDLATSGQCFIFRMSYATAWVSNFDHDVFDFMKRLPEGEYGIAYLDADDSDGRETVSVRCYLWCGRGEAAKRKTFKVDAGELRSHIDALMVSGMDELDLADHALVENMRQWTGDADSDGQREKSEPEEGLIDQGVEFVGLINAGAALLDEAWPALLDMLSDLPLTVGVSGTAYRARERSIGTLIVDDELVLRSDWESPYFSPVGIEVFTAEGDSIGNLAHHGLHGHDFLSDALRVALALALPHVHAVVQEVIPLFMRRKSAKSSYLLIRLDLEVLDWDELKEEVRLMLGQTFTERARESAHGPRDEGGEGV